MNTEVASLRYQLRIAKARPTQIVLGEGITIELKHADVKTNEFDVYQGIEEVDYELNLSLEIEKGTLRRMLAHKIEVLKLTSQAIHYTFFAL